MFASGRDAATAIGLEDNPVTRNVARDWHVGKRKPHLDQGL
jgi:hypothetical protein